MKNNKKSLFFLFYLIAIVVAKITYGADDSICYCHCKSRVNKDDPSKISDELIFVSFDGADFASSRFAISDQNYLEVVSENQYVETFIMKNHTLTNPTAFSIPSLKVLKLSHGTLNIFSLFSHLQQLPQLQELDLSHNKITTLDSALTVAFPHNTVFGNLKKLNLSHNQLKVLDFPLLNRLNGLEEVDLCNNPIHTIAAVSEPEAATVTRFFPRTLTKVLLASHNLSAADKKSLAAYYHDLAPFYKKRLETKGLKWGFGLGLGGALSLCMVANWLYVVNGAENMPNEAAPALIGIDMIGLIGGFLSFGTVGVALGRAYAQYKTPLDQRRAQIFNFVFERHEEPRHELLQCELPAGSEIVG